MARRVFTSFAVAAIATATLAGCSASSAGGFGSAIAKTQSASWIAMAGTAAGASKVTPKSAVQLDCELDTGYIKTSSDWRLISTLTVPSGTTTTAIANISKQFTAQGWRAKLLDGVLALNSPRAAAHPGIVRVDTTRPTSLSIDSTSGCFK